MSGKTMAIALLGALLVAALALPVSAVPGNGNAYGKDKKIDDGLKKDLWDVYGKYRIQIFDLRVEGSGEAVEVLGEHGCPTDDLEATLAEIGEQRDPLVEALDNHDRAALKDVNQALAKLWKEFRQEFRESLKACGDLAGTADVAGMDAL